MLIDLKRIPFSRQGSYLVISYLTKDFNMYWNTTPKTQEGLYLRLVRGDSRMRPILGRLLPLNYGEPVPYQYEADPTEIRIKTASGNIFICFADEDTLIFKGTGEGIGLRLDGIADGGYYDYVHELPYNNKTHYVINCFKNSDKFVLVNQMGKIELKQKWNVQTSSESTLDFLEEDGVFQINLEETKIEWKHRDLIFDYDECKDKLEHEFETFYHSMPEVALEYESLRKQAAYINWVSQVKKTGLLTRDAIYPSKNWMIGAYSWDHCFVAMALSHHNPQMAWDQFMLMFDYQDETGRIPDSVSDANISWNFCKPPVHGWTLMNMMKHMTLTKEQLEEAYYRISKWTKWWYTYRDTDHDGVCEYWHGNDSGWDNATVFRFTPTVETAELSAYLVLQCEALSVLANKLGYENDTIYWIERSRKQLSDMLRHCFMGNKPLVKINNSHEEVPNDCMLPFSSVVLGKRLPKEITDYIVSRLSSEEFLTEYGVATESTKSEFFLSDGYWRGPIWAPSTMIVMDGLDQLGEYDLVKDIARKFVKLVDNSGFAENYDAINGNARRDTAFTWTASVFLLIANQYLL